MLKILFAVPPLNSEKGIAQATQNRQYQFFREPTYIYPVIPAIFISMLLTSEKVNTAWLDCVASDLDDLEFGKNVFQIQPDYIVFEANTMLFNKYAEFINGIKKNLPNIKIILTGEHLTAFPETIKSQVNADYFIPGGKWYYEAFKLITGEDWPKEKLLPHINREATAWWLYAYNNGNYRHTPATYMMAAQDCWYRPKDIEGNSTACIFCSWVKYHPKCEERPVNDYLQEVEELINFGFKEFFDDSGTFPVGGWLRKFCSGMIERGYNKHISWGCNMRFKALSPEDFVLMKQAGCRFILWGYESANQRTLDNLRKGYSYKDMSESLIMSKMNGIWNHLTVMVGYPWESFKEERNTFNMVKWLLLNDWAESVQATIFMPYPGTVAFDEMKKDGLVLTEDWSKWDMTNEVVKLKYPLKEALNLQRDYYNISYHPRFILNKISKIRSFDDLKFYFNLSKRVFNRFVGVHNVTL